MFRSFSGAVILFIAVFTSAEVRADAGTAHFKHIRIHEKTVDGKAEKHEFESEIWLKGDKLRQETKSAEFTYILFFTDGWFYTYYSNKDTVNRYADKKYFHESGKEMKEKFAGKPVAPDAKITAIEEVNGHKCCVYENSTEKTDKMINGTEKREALKTKEWRRETDNVLIKSINEVIKQIKDATGKQSEEKEVIFVHNREIETNSDIPDIMFKIPNNIKIIDR